VRFVKPAPDPWIELPTRARRACPAAGGRWLEPPPRRDPIDLVFGTIWAFLTLPFRIVFGAFGLVGRLAGIVVGFALMVLGAAVSASPFGLLGLAIFGAGLLIAMRSLG